MLFMHMFHLLYPSVLANLDSKISEGRVHVGHIWGQKRQKSRSMKDV